MNSIFARVNEEPTILKLMDDHIKLLKLRVGKDYTKSTYEKYGRSSSFWTFIGQIQPKNCNIWVMLLEHNPIY